MARFLSDSDVKILQKIIDRERDNPTNKTRPQLRPELSQTQDLYIARVSSDDQEIKALTAEDGSTEAVAGEAICDIYQVVLDGSSNPDLVDTGITEYVYNIAESSIDRLYFSVSRSKYGVWIANTTSDNVVGIVLTEDMGNTTTGEASCTVKPNWDASAEAYSSTGSFTGVAKDVQGIFVDATDASEGMGKLRMGDDRRVVEIYNMECP